MTQSIDQIKQRQLFSRDVLILLVQLFLVVIFSPSNGLTTPVNARIIDGTAVSENTYPYVARLSTNGELLCTGTLVSPNHILTAAHCFFGENNRRAVGDSDVSARLGGQIIASSKVYIHPAYKSRSSACVEKETDAAIVELSSPVSGITPITLIDSPLSAGSALRLVGYGTLGSGSTGENGSIPPDGTVYHGATSIEGYGDNPPEQDNNSSYFYWTFNSGEANTASGDSGGPAFYDTGSVYQLAGITCGGDGNAEIGTLSFDTRADLIKAWVDSITGFTPTNTPPGFGSFASVSTSVGNALSFRVPVTGSSPLTLTAAGLPDGVSLSGTTISGTPASAGTFNVSLEASNGFGNASTTLTIVVAPYSPTVSMKSVLLQFDNDGGNSDFLDIVGSIKVGKNLKPKGKRVAVKIGRFSKSFKLMSNGQSSGSSKSFFDLSGDMKNGKFQKTSLRFDLTFERVKLFKELSTLGFPSSDDATNGQRISLPLAITIDGIEWSTTATLRFRDSDARWVKAK